MLEIKNLKNFYADRLILNIDSLKLELGDKLGVVGSNGSGKTSFLELVNGSIKADKGYVKTYEKFKYMPQLGGIGLKTIDGKLASKMDIETDWSDNLSGGEKTRFKLAGILADRKQPLLLDEPTNNLDMEGIEFLESALLDYSKGFIMVSHNRRLLDRVCNKILEIENGTLSLYDGNFSFYKKCKDEELLVKKREYSKYIEEKVRLEDSYREIEGKSTKVRRTPKRMGNSEARLHRMGGQTAKKNLDNRKKNIKTRLEQLEKVDKPSKDHKIFLEIEESSKIYKRILVEASNINKKFSERTIFEDSSFQIYTGSKVGLLGKNGSGKTTLINMIMNDESIKKPKGLKIAYFDQELENLDPSTSLMKNVMSTSVYSEEFARKFLNRLGIRKDSLYEKLELLSGGERVEVSLVKLLLEDSNFLILDEPTNHLDIKSLEALEEALINYNGSILLISHDEEFLENIVDNILYIEDKKIRSYMGGYDDFKNRNTVSEYDGGEILLLENRLNTIISLISVSDSIEEKKKLDIEYDKILYAINKIKNDCGR